MCSEERTGTVLRSRLSRTTTRHTPPKSFYNIVKIHPSDRPKVTVAVTATDRSSTGVSDFTPPCRFANCRRRRRHVCCTARIYNPLPKDPRRRPTATAAAGRVSPSPLSSTRPPSQFRLYRFALSRNSNGEKSAISDAAAAVRFRVSTFGWPTTNSSRLRVTRVQQSKLYPSLKAYSPSPSRSARLKVVIETRHCRQSCCPCGS